MKRIFLPACLCLAFALSVGAQQNPSDAPATRDDIQRYMNVMHSREIASQMVDAMSKPIREMIHQRYLRDKDKLPADYEARMNKCFDESMKSMPWDEVLDATAAVYQKHLTKGDVDAIVAFYSGPTGQKLLRELPTMMSETMENMMPLLRKHMDAMRGRLEEQSAQILKESNPGQGDKPPVSRK